MSGDITQQYDITTAGLDLRKLGLPTDVSKIDPDLQRVLEDSLDAKHAGDSGVFEGFTFGNVQSVNDFMRAVGWAEEFAATTGYRWFPPLQSLASMANPYWQKLAGGYDKQKAFDAFYALLPQDMQEKMPYARVGMTQQDWNDTVATYQDQYERATGTRDMDPGLLQTAVREHWSTERLMNHLQKDATFNSQYGWVQHGKTFQEWQAYKLEHQNEVNSRYGDIAKGSDAFFLQNLETPLQQFSGSSTVIQPADPTKGPRANNASAVR